MEPTLVPWIEQVVRLVLAALLGAALGLERELRQKSAGLRTNMLVTLGAALFTLVSLELGRFDGADPGRIAAQIVTGIGFLGAGAIFRTGVSVQGLTTAATIWVNAGIGMAAGAGELRLAVSATVVTVLVAGALIPLDQYLDRRSQRLDEKGVDGAARATRGNDSA